MRAAVPGGLFEDPDTDLTPLFGGGSVVLPLPNPPTTVGEQRLRTGEWAELDREHALDNAGALLLDWCLGTIPVGITIGLVMGVLSWAFARRRDRRRAEEDAISKSAQPSTGDEPASDLAESKRPRDALSDPESTSGA